MSMVLSGVLTREQVTAYCDNLKESLLQHVDAGMPLFIKIDRDIVEFPGGFDSLHMGSEHVIVRVATGRPAARLAAEERARGGLPA